MATIEIEVRLNDKNELTLPEEVVKRLKLEPGQRLVLELEAENPNQMQVRPLRRSYRGLLTGVYGSDEEALEYVRAERASSGQ